MDIIDRIGIDIGVKKSVEDGLSWAAIHGLRYVDFRLDTSSDAFAAFTPTRCAALRSRAEANGITMGLHTLSAVNIAEFSPYLSEAADHYLELVAEFNWMEITHASSASLLLFRFGSDPGPFADCLLGQLHHIAHQLVQIERQDRPRPRHLQCRPQTFFGLVEFVPVAF